MTRRILAALSFLVIFSFHSIALAQSNDTVAPADVERLVATAGNSSVTLQWDVAWDNVGVEGYKVYYGTHSVNNANTARYPVVIKTGNVIEYKVTGLLPGKAYYFAVTAFDKAGNESMYYSPEVMAVPGGDLLATQNIELLSTSVVAQAEGGDTATLENLIDSLEEGGDGEDVKATGPVEGEEVLAESVDEDLEAPRVISAEAVDNIHLVVVFSEKVTLPSGETQAAFIIQDNLTLDILEVVSVEYLKDDETGATLVLETAPQIPETEYILTVGSSVEDVAGNPVVSGTSDTALFVGSDGKPVDPNAEPEKGGEGEGEKSVGVGEEVGGEVAEAFSSPPGDFKLESIEVKNESSFKVTFSEPVVLSLDPLENFSVVLVDDPDQELEIIGVSVSEDNKAVTITTALQTDAFYALKVEGVTTAEGVELKQDDNSFEFQGGGKAEADTTPPEDVTNLTGKALDSARALLKWTGSLDSAGDLVEYMLYQSKDGKTYGKIKALPKSALQHTVEGLAPGDYYFKLSATDASGNESDGVAVMVTLVETGPGVGLIALLSLGLGSRFGRRKKKKQ